MHEFSIAQNIIEICDSNIPDGNVKIKKVELEIGKLSGVVLEALETAMQQIIKKTIYENAEIKINVIEATGKCLNCGFEFEADDYYSQCPNCKGFGIKLIKGNEMRIKAIELV